MRLQLDFIKYALFILFLFLFIACEKALIEPITYPDVSAELCPYFQSFEEEAANRDISINLKLAGIKGKLVNIQNGYVGLCSTHAKKEILIDRDFWKRSSRLIKELIVFHELGHCSLERKHNNQQAANGTCASIMRSGLGGCVDFYTEKTRAQLLDELFSNF